MSMNAFQVMNNVCVCVTLKNMISSAIESTFCEEFYSQKVMPHITDFTLQLNY